MERKILLIADVTELLRVAPSTIHRWLGQRRKGIGTFPLPVSCWGGKLRWLASDVNKWLAAQSQAATPPIIPTARSNTQDNKDFPERQGRAEADVEKQRTAMSDTGVQNTSNRK
jgi:predicted DNA-binding transcriptional regulator AlpA